MWRETAVASLAVGFVLASAGTASAWWAEGSWFAGSGNVYVHAEPGEANDLVATLEPKLESPGTTGSVVVHDPTLPVTRVGNGCTQLDAHTLRCTGIGVPVPSPTSPSRLRVDLGDLDDRLRVPMTPLGVYKFGSTGSGNDTVVTEDLDGGELALGDGDDSISMRWSGEPIYPGGGTSGGPGNDTLRLVNGSDDNPHCGEGDDVLYADLTETHTGCETVHPLGVELP